MGVSQCSDQKGGDRPTPEAGEASALGRREHKFTRFQQAEFMRHPFDHSTGIRP